MTEKQRFMIYIKLGCLLADVRKKNNIGICDAVKCLLDRKIVHKIEDLETGYYLESSAYLAEVFKLS